MAEADALGKFDFSSVMGGLFLKFESGKPVTLRVLTVDPVVSTKEFEDKKTGETNLATQFAFIVFNHTANKAQILQTGPGMAKKIGELHVDPDFGSNIRNIDIKITPTGEGLQRKYDIQVLPTAIELTKEMVEACKAIDLDAKVDGDRMSLYDPAKARGPAKPQPSPGATDDVEIEDMEAEEEPINLDDIPF